MKNVVLAVLLHGCILAGFVVFLLWNGGYFGRSELPVADSLPVVPKVVPADPLRAVLFEQLQDGRAVCVGGFYAVRAMDGSAVEIHSNGERVSCP